MTVGIPDDFPAIPGCTDCGNGLKVHGRYVARHERIILAQREGEDAPTG